MEIIQTVTVGSGGASEIVLSSIPSGYDDLVLVTSLRHDNNVSTWQQVRYTFNGSTSGYSSRLLFGDGSSAGSDSASSQSSMPFFYGTYANATANTFASGQIYIPNYRSSVAKSVSMDSASENNATSAIQALTAGLWSGTDPITSIRLFSLFSGNFVQGSSASLYGIRKFNTSAQPKATGGAISFDAVNNKWVHVFTASGTFTPTENLTGVEYLVVAGGGGGGSNSGGFAGGGGAGGYRSSVIGQSSGGGSSAESTLSLTSGVGQTVTVGAGGGVNASGNNSVFGSITASGGGRGGNTSGGAGVSGGSGGGGGESGSGASGTANQGYAGGNGSFSSTGGGGGGGGAGAVGTTPTTSSGGGNGGDGVSSNITGTAVVRAGGGAGGSDAGTRGTGGTGGGGAGADLPSTASVAGQPNSGSGGGGGVTSLAGAAGGSGIVIVRYNA